MRGTGNDALIDGLLELGVGVARAFRPEVADRREAGVQRRAQMIDAAGGPEAQRFAQDLVAPARLVVRMEQDVRMSLDEPRQERRPGQVDHLRAGGRGARRRTGGLDAVALDADHPAFVKRVAVEHARRLEHHHRGGRVARRAVLPGRNRVRRHGQREPRHSTFHLADLSLRRPDARVASSEAGSVTYLMAGTPAGEGTSL